tara:strand:+ start:5763 stop:7661 length:1899 start_codon:yes stop_codon:yes gene_type:complete
MYKHILLCGGLGIRLKKEFFFNKPLNLVQGLPMLKYVLDSIPSEEITVIAGYHLYKNQLDSVIHHMTNKKIDFIYLDRPTRGPVESAYLGLKNLTHIKSDDSIIFYDNDTIYKGINLPKEPCNAIGYLEIENKNNSYPYCFLKIKDNYIKGIFEKEQISEFYASGIYMFQSKDFFMKNSYRLIIESEENEIYMSSFYKNLIKDNYKVKPFKIDSGICLGTYEDICRNISKIPFKKLRVCFDLDNTLFRYKFPNENYSDIKPIEESINLLKTLKNLGHEIIIYTARGMATANQNLGSSLKRVGKDTFDVLHKYKIPYDEIYFGKPNADIYIDDKAFNPALDLNKSIGFPNIKEEKFNPTNKFNSIVIEDKYIYKKGPANSMHGEIFFYNCIKEKSISRFYPSFISADIENNKATIKLSRIIGFEFFKLLKDELMSFSHIDKLINALNKIHKENTEINIAVNDIYENYIGKLKSRFTSDEDYPFVNKYEFLNKIEPIIKDYLFSDKFKIAGFVNGDPWLSNTMLDVNSNIKFLDMKGDINGKLTTNGDPLTDYCKIMQSLYGFDYIVSDLEINENYLLDLREYYQNKLESIGYSLITIKAITACLIAKTISFFEKDSKYKNAIWDISIKLFDSI